MNRTIEQVKWWLAEEVYNNRFKTFSVTKGERCDWCNAEMKFAGANFRNNVKRACAFHLNTAKSYLRKQREEYGLTAKKGNSK